MIKPSEKILKVLMSCENLTQLFVFWDWYLGIKTKDYRDFYLITDAYLLKKLNLINQSMEKYKNG